jgi:hypothetical protein
MTKVIPNGTYWWHVRSVSPEGAVSPWSPARSFTKSWAPQPTLVSPAEGDTITYPAEPFRLAWTPVPGAFKYSVSVATDPTLASIVWSGGPVKTQATSFTLSSPLAPDKTYFWGVTPIDAQGNLGSPSDVRSFRWEWPSQTRPVVRDVASQVEIYDHEFSWDRVPGALGYELEISTSSDFAPGSWVCCPVNFITKVTTIATSYSPTIALPNNNSYYWRVRAVDSSKNTGVWNEGPPFLKSFDNVLPSVKNLRMLDNPFPSEGNFETSTPVVAWDPVPGASSYEVEVTPFAAGCQWSVNVSHWFSKTATTAWTPLGSGWNGIKPYQSPATVSTDIPALIAGQEYCVRVTALDRPSDLLSPYIRSAEAYLPDESTPAFTWTGPPGGGECSEPCNSGSLGSADYHLPLRGEVKRSMPLFRWAPLAGYESYYILVAKDPEFTNIVDYAFTKLPAYAPRTGFLPKTYADETTSLYWAVLPATNSNGSGVTTAPRFSAPASFQKQSLPPALLSPANGTIFPGQARFHWTPAEGARRYRLQVSKDPTFSDVNALVEDLITVNGTDSTAYTSSTSYPADVNLFWRVRADDENATGLTWSPTGTFRKTLPAPVPDPANPTGGDAGGDAIPTWEWALVPGAVSYDLQVEFPNGGTPRLYQFLPSTAATPTEMKGTGKWHWRVRANFPKVNQISVTPGPWSPQGEFTRTIREPANPTADVGSHNVALRWDPKLGALNYRVQISSRPDFSIMLESQTTDNPSFAPFLTAFGYAAGGSFYWRVAAADDIVANVGDYTATQSFTLPPRSVTTARTATTTTAMVSKTVRAVKVRGSVFPRHTGSRVSVTLLRKRNGAFRTLAVKRPTIGSAGGYATSFARPRPGYCRVVSRFGGDADHLPSKKTVAFRC